MTKWRFFMDETGDHGLGFIDPSFPIFLLAGCLITEENYQIFSAKINDFKRKYFLTTEVVLHSRDIRKQNDPFSILFDLDTKKKFYDDLNQIVEETDFIILGSGIDKEKHIKAYGKAARDPYEISLGFILERLIFCLDEHTDSESVYIQIEKRGRKEDSMLLDHYNSLIDKGTYYVDSARLRTKISRFDFVHKLDNINGLQLADLCAYPLARHCLNAEAPNISFDIIKPKIRSKNGRYMKYGLKLFP